MRFLFLLIFLMAIASYSTFGQSGEDTLKGTHTHEHSKNEIGIALSPAYFLFEKAWTFAMHIHYTRIVPNTKFGLGASFERIVLDPEHSTFGFVIAYYPVEKLSFTLSPGVTYEDANEVSLFALHIETAYEFELGKIHIGPAFEFAYDPNDYHLSLGLHVGYGF